MVTLAGEPGPRPAHRCLGAIEIDVPRNRAGNFEPQIVKKRQRRLTDVDEAIYTAPNEEAAALAMEDFRTQ